MMRIILFINPPAQESITVLFRFEQLPYAFIKEALLSFLSHSDLCHLGMTDKKMAGLCLAESLERPRIVSQKVYDTWIKNLFLKADALQSVLNRYESFKASLEIEKVWTNILDIETKLWVLKYAFRAFPEKQYSTDFLLKWGKLINASLKDKASALKTRAFLVDAYSSIETAEKTVLDELCDEYEKSLLPEPLTELSGLIQWFEKMPFEAVQFYCSIISDTKKEAVVARYLSFFKKENLNPIYWESLSKMIAVLIMTMTDKTRQERALWAVVKSRQTISKESFEEKNHAMFQMASILQYAYPQLESSDFKTDLTKGFIQALDEEESVQVTLIRLLFELKWDSKKPMPDDLQKAVLSSLKVFLYRQDLQSFRPKKVLSEYITIQKLLSLLSWENQAQFVDFLSERYPLLRQDYQQDVLINLIAFYKKTQHLEYASTLEEIMRNLLKMGVDDSDFYQAFLNQLHRIASSVYCEKYAVESYLNPASHDFYWAQLDTLMRLAPKAYPLLNSILVSELTENAPKLPFSVLLKIKQKYTSRYLLAHCQERGSTIKHYPGLRDMQEKLAYVQKEINCGFEKQVVLELVKQAKQWDILKKGQAAFLLSHVLSSLKSPKLRDVGFAWLVNIFIDLKSDGSNIAKMKQQTVLLDWIYPHAGMLHHLSSEAQIRFQEALSQYLECNPGLCSAAINDTAMSLYAQLLTAEKWSKDTFTEAMPLSPLQGKTLLAFRQVCIKSSTDVPSTLEALSSEKSSCKRLSL